MVMDLGDGQADHVGDVRSIGIVGAGPSLIAEAVRPVEPDVAPETEALVVTAPGAVLDATRAAAAGGPPPDVVADVRGGVGGMGVAIDPWGIARAGRRMLDHPRTAGRWRAFLVVVQPVAG